jgi:glutamyl-tRNA reductase
VRAALKQRKRKPMFIVDLAVPRDVAADVADLEDVYLYTVDDLEGVIRENLRSREEAARQARRIIEAEVARFNASLRVRDSAPTIRDLREKAAGIRATVETQARQMLANGKAPEDVVAFISRTLTNKLLHGPSAGLRRAGEHGDGELIRAARRLYGLPDDEG